MAPAHPVFDVPSGYYDLPAGKLASIVTSLEMLSPPAGSATDVSAVGAAKGLTLSKWDQPAPDAYRALYRLVGEEWLWFSRLRMSDEDLSTAIHDPQVDVYQLKSNGVAGGLLELDYREPATCEIAFFGLGPELIGAGAGRWLMAQTLSIAWARPIERLWVHTCTLDHPRALDFYRRSGLVPFKQQIEVTDDPRLDGTLPETAAPHIPLLR